MVGGLFTFLSLLRRKTETLQTLRNGLNLSVRITQFGNSKLPNNKFVDSNE